MSALMQLKNIFLEVIFPSDGRCVFCKRLLLFENSPFCYNCVGKVPWIGKSVCSKCGKEELLADTLLCMDCAHHKHRFYQGIALFTYTIQGKKIIQEIKYEGNTKLARWVGEKMGKQVKDKGWQELDMIIPVPLHLNRLKERGFNQSLELAKGMKNSLNIPMKKDLLIRIKDTPHQTDLSKSERQKNIQNAFNVEDDKAIQGKKVLLIDDVYTTGATINACADTLLQAGAKEVYFAVAATGRSIIR